MAGLLQTVQKIGPVLDLFTIGRPEWGVAEVSGELGVPRSSAHAMLASLVDIGILQRRSRGRYRIGWRVVEMNETLKGTFDVRACAAPTLQRLSDHCRETVHLAVLDRYQAMYVDKVIGNQVVNVAGARIGAHLAAHCSAVGKVLLADRAPAEIDRHVLDRPLRRLTPSTITDPAALHGALRAVRERGWAVDEGEAVGEVHCVAAPVRDERDVVVAAVSVTAPATRFAAAQHKYRRAVIAAAAEVSRAVVTADEIPTVPAPETVLRAVAG